MSKVFETIRGEIWVYKGMFIGTRELWFWVSSDPVKGHCMHVYHSLQSLKSFPSLANKSTSWWVVGTKIALHQRPPPPCCVGRLRRNSGGNANQLRQGATNWSHYLCTLRRKYLYQVWSCLTWKTKMLSIIKPNILPKCIFTKSRLVWWCIGFGTKIAATSWIDRLAGLPPTEFPRTGFGARGFTHSHDPPVVPRTFNLCNPWEDNSHKKTKLKRPAYKANLSWSALCIHRTICQLNMLELSTCKNLSRILSEWILKS